MAPSHSGAALLDKNKNGFATHRRSENSQSVSLTVEPRALPADTDTCDQTSSHRSDACGLIRGKRKNDSDCKSEIAVRGVTRISGTPWTVSTNSDVSSVTPSQSGDARGHIRRKQKSCMNDSNGSQILKSLCSVRAHADIQWKQISLMAKCHGRKHLCRIREQMKLDATDLRGAWILDPHVATMSHAILQQAQMCPHSAKSPAGDARGHIRRMKKFAPI